MEDTDFQGTLVLEKLAEINRVDEFFEAVESDDFDRARLLMRQAGIEADTIVTVMRMIKDGD